MNHLPFIAIAAFLTLSVVLWLIYPLLRQMPNERSASRRALNVAVYRDELQELAREQQEGSLAQADYQQAHDELQQRLLEDALSPEIAAGSSQKTWLSALLLAVLLPLTAGALYAWLGNPAALDPPVETGITPAQVEDMVAKLSAHMEKNPDDIQGWKMLARSSKVLRHYDQAAHAFERILALGGDQDPDQLAEYADVLIAQADGEFAEKPRQLLAQALKLDPDHMMALALAGSAAYANDDYASALQHWERLQQLLPADSEEAKSLATALIDIRNKTAETTNKTSANKSPASQKNNKTVQGTISLTPSLRAQTRPEDVLYISAHAVDGPRMPLAVLRARVADLPLHFTLDDSLALTPQHKLSSASQVNIEARISRSGDATPHSGDLHGQQTAVNPGGQDVQVLIDQVLP